MLKKENLIKVLKHDKPSYIPWYTEGSFIMVSSSFIERPLTAGYDSWGVYWEYVDKDIGTFPTHKFLLKDINELDHYKFPDPGEKNLFDITKETIKKINREEVFILGYTDFGMFERSWLLLGMENLLVYMLTNPESICNFYEKFVNFKIKLIERFAELKVDGIWLGDDWGTQDSLFINPQLWRKLIKPYQAKLYKACKERGLWVFQHSCGHIEEIFGDLVEIGLDCWHPCQPKSNNLLELKKIYGSKITFYGGIDAQEVLPLGTPEDVKKETLKRIFELGDGGGYIAGPSHDVPFPQENVDMMINTIRKYGKYPLDKLLLKELLKK